MPEITGSSGFLPSMASPLCATCKDIDIQEFIGPGNEFLHVPRLADARDLLSSAQHCVLRALFLAAFDQANRGWDLPHNISGKDAIFSSLRLQRTAAPTKSKHGSKPIVSINVVAPLLSSPSHINTLTHSNWDYEGMYYPKHCAILGRLHLYAYPDSPAATSDIVGGKPPILNSGSEEAHTCVRNWMNDCISNHTECRLTVSGHVEDILEKSVLPTRILDLGTDRSFNQIRLIKTKGIKGHYVALSHCWGPPSKHTTTTTKATEPDRYKGIPLATLPRVHRDAVSVRRAVRLRYPWIDSLCILQDNKDDWLNESAKMGQYYSLARMVIAASWARDPTEGCFKVRPPLPPAVELSYRTLFGEVAGSMYIALGYGRKDRSLPDLRREFDVLDVSDEPLSSRAWVTQELLLARRTIFYTGGRLLWSCRTHREDEAGDSYPQMDKSLSLKWLHLIQAYSARALTYDSDKLVALQGIANELQLTRANEYRFGLWTGDLPLVLLWEGKGRLEKYPKGLGIPSWASCKGPITFRRPGGYLSYDSQSHKSYGDRVKFCRDIRILGHGLMILHGQIKKVPDAMRQLSYRPETLETLANIEYYEAAYGKQEDTCTMIGEGEARLGVGRL